MGRRRRAAAFFMTARKTSRTKTAAKKTTGVKRPARRRTAKNIRDAINVLALIEALEQHVLGEKKMTSTQVSAALALLEQTLPDIAAPAGKPAEAPASAVLSHEDALQALE